MKIIGSIGAESEDTCLPIVDGYELAVFRDF